MKVGPVTVEESRGPIYISPEINGDDMTNCWAMWVFPDGSAQIYLKRKKDGAVLGKPIKIPALKHEHRFEHYRPQVYRHCLGCGREFKYVPSASGPIEEEHKDGINP